MQDVKYLVTVGEGKYFTTGVDLEVVRSSHSQSFLNVLSDLQKLLSRLLVFPIITIAAINGMQVICFSLDVGQLWLLHPLSTYGYTSQTVK